MGCYFTVQMETDPKHRVSNPGAFEGNEVEYSSIGSQSLDHNLVEHASHLLEINEIQKDTGTKTHKIKAVKRNLRIMLVSE